MCICYSMYVRTDINLRIFVVLFRGFLFVCFGGAVYWRRAETSVYNVAGAVF